ncbi:MAG TPA: glycosyltransferase, partial [Methanomassiliicoccales archaeon]|nr:glycosyltransferase [Methanomassiliicoccales archaeon]
MNKGEITPSCRVLMLLTNEYRPDPRVRKEAVALTKNNYSVTIISWDRNKKHPKSEESEGVHLERVRTGSVTGPLGMVMNYPLFAVRATCRALRSGFDSVHAHDLDTLLIGRLLAWLKGVPLVFDAHEQYGRMIRTDVPDSIARLAESLEKRLMSKVDLAITVNGRIADRMRPNVKGSTIVIMNAVDVPGFKASNDNRPDGELTLYYGGTLEPMRYIEEMVEAVGGAVGVRIVFAGNGRLRDFVEAASKMHSNIEFHGFLPHSTMMQEMSSADV